MTMTKRDPNESENTQRTGSGEDPGSIMDEQAIGERDQTAAIDPNNYPAADTAGGVQGGSLADATGGLPVDKDGNRVRKATQAVGHTFGTPGTGGLVDQMTRPLGEDSDITGNVDELRENLQRAQEGGLGGQTAGADRLRDNVGPGPGPSSTQSSGATDSLSDPPGGMGGAGDAATTGSPEGSTGAGIGGFARALGGAADSGMTDTDARRQAEPDSPLPDPTQSPDAETIREFLMEDDLPGTRRVVDITDNLTPEATEEERRGY